MRERTATPRFQTFALLAAVAVLALPVKPLSAEEPSLPDVSVTWGERIPLRDGVELSATIYRPLEQTDPLSVVFTLTPYESDAYHSRAWYFAQHGYVFALVDVRGRGNSEGVFRPMIQEAEDGYDVVEWIAKQSWSNGKVTMWGGSYAGYNQWAAAKELPPHLETIVPAAAAFPGYDFPMWKNIPGQYDMQWLTLTSGKFSNSRLFGASDYWINVYHRLYEKHLPFTELPKIAGNTTTAFDEWIAHPMLDDYWDAFVPTTEEYAKIDIPILTITGVYDGDQPGAMRFYRQHMRHANDEAKGRHYLIVGPWNHSGTRTPSKEVGGLVFGDASMLDLNDLHRQWYDWTMKDGDEPEFLKDRVAYFVIGANEWRYASSLETIASENRKLYLSSVDGKAEDAFHSGWLTTEPPSVDEKPDRWTNDPLDTRPGSLELEEIDDYLTDETSALELFGAGAVYHTEPFDRDTVIAGYLKLEAWIETDVPDTDFQVSVYEILRNGKSVYLTGDQIRARYRESLRSEKLLEPGEIGRYEFDGFFFTSRKIAEGSRIRLVVRSLNSIYDQKNYQSGGIVAHESGEEARTAHVALHHDAGHPSALTIPVVE